MIEQTTSPLTTKKPPKPAMVKVLLGLMIAVGGFNLFDTAGYILLAGVVSNPVYASGEAVLASLALLCSAGTLLTAAIFFILSLGIWKGKKLAWSATVFFSIICLCVSLAMAAISGFIVLLLFAAILFCLTRKDVKIFCGKTPKQAQPATEPQPARPVQATLDKR